MKQTTLKALFSTIVFVSVKADQPKSIIASSGRSNQSLIKLLDRVKLVVSLNDPSPIMSVLSLGRSNR